MSEEISSCVFQRFPIRMLLKVLALNGLNVSVAEGSTKTVFHMISLQIPMERVNVPFLLYLS